MSAVEAIGGYGFQRSAVWGLAYYYSMGMGAAKSAASRPSQPETPVEPVQPVKPLQAEAPVRMPVPVRTALPSEAELNNAGDTIARMSIEYQDRPAQFRMGPQGLERNAPEIVEAAEDGKVGTGVKAQGEADTADALRRGQLGAAGDELLRTALGEEGEAEAAAVKDSAAHFEPMEPVRKTECQTCARRKYQDGSDDPGVSFKTPTEISPEEAPAAVRGHEQEHVVRERAKAEREGRKVVSQSVMIHTDVCPECGRVYVSGGVTRTVTAEDNSDEQLREQRKRRAGNGLRLDDVMAA